MGVWLHWFEPVCWNCNDWQKKKVFHRTWLKNVFLKPSQSFEINEEDQPHFYFLINLELSFPHNCSFQKLLYELSCFIIFYCYQTPYKLANGWYCDPECNNFPLVSVHASLRWRCWFWRTSVKSKEGFCWAIFLFIEIPVLLAELFC